MTKYITSNHGLHHSTGQDHSVQDQRKASYFTEFLAKEKRLFLRSMSSHTQLRFEVNTLHKATLIARTNKRGFEVYVLSQAFLLWVQFLSLSNLKEALGLKC